MRIALVTPQSSHSLAHRVRGSGFYAQNLIKALSKYFPKNEYILSSYNKIDKSDLVHFPYFEPFFLTLPLYKKFKSVITVHDLIPFVFPNEFPSGIKGKLKWEVQKKILKGMDSIITDSNSSKKDIVRFTGIDEKKIHVVYLAASEEFRQIKELSILDSIESKYKLPKKFVLYVGDVTWNKNLPRFVEAITKINIPLVMVGKALIEKNFDKSNPWNQDLVKVQQLAEKNKKIIRLGFVPDEDLVTLYNIATVFVMPSIYEGFGLPVLEAMNCGCPVVTTKEGSIPEIAENAAFYVDAYDVDNIAKGIKEVFLNESLQKELSKKGLEQAKKFSWKKTAEETMDCYLKILMGG